MKALYYRMVLPFLHKFSLLLSVIVYVAFINKIILSKLLLYLGLAVMTTIGFMAIGYLSNDLADIEKDKKANKPNSLLGKQPISIFLLFALAFIVALFPWFFFKITSVSVWLIVAELLCFFVYAFPPFRLKEKGFWGCVLDALYAHVIPTLLAAYTFYLLSPQIVFSKRLVVLFMIWLWLYGIRNIISHQIEDAENDVLSNTKTYVTEASVSSAKRLLFYGFIPIEFLLFIAMTLLLQFPFFIISFIYMFFVLSYFFKRKMVNKQSLNYNETDLVAYSFYNGCISNEFYERYLLFVVLGLLAIDFLLKLFIL